MSSSKAAKVPPTIFRIYIGAESSPVLTYFPDIINPNVKEFHFILAFATEVYDENTKIGTGYFNLMPSLSPFNADSIQKLKKKHTNAKVVISIGGRGSQYAFNTNDKDKWLDNAKKSLKKIIGRFKESGRNLIDGIDVNYENIESGANDFAESIGKLIKSLGEDGYAKVVSIAPSESVRPQYETLFLKYGKYIHWVDYQFYDQKLDKLEDFITLFHELSNVYSNDKLLAGFSTDPSDAGNISLGDFLGGCGRFLEDNSLPGIFVWNANDSAQNDVAVQGLKASPIQLENVAQDVTWTHTNDSAVKANPFHVERLLQVLLVDFN